MGKSFFCLIGTALMLCGAREAYIRFMPLPSIPRESTPSYRVTDTHQILATFVVPDYRIHFYYRLTDQGAVAFSADGNFALFHWTSETSSNGYAIDDTPSSFQLRKNNLYVSTKQHGVSGYLWRDYYATLLYKVNARGEVIGNTNLTTDYPTCTHSFEGHMRPVPFLWRSDGTVHDLNALVAPGDYYLTNAVDSNDRGQILCLAQHTDAKGAEHGIRVRPDHLVILTPIARTDSHSAVQ